LINLEIPPQSIEDVGKFFSSLDEFMDIKPIRMILHFEGGSCDVDLSGRVIIVGFSDESIVRMFTEKQLCKT